MKFSFAYKNEKKYKKLYGIIPVKKLNIKVFLIYQPLL